MNTSTPSIVSRTQWLQRRMLLLQQEKRVTRELDKLARARQQMPWVAVEKNYHFETAAGRADLLRLFGEYEQLIIYHFMLGPEWPAPCDGCSAWADALDGTIQHIQQHNAQLLVVSRAPFAELQAVQRDRGWTFSWASSYGSDFNFDYHMSAELDCASKQIADETVFYDRGESGGISVFARQGEQVYHTYSTYNRGIQQMNGAYGYVDLLPFGGN